MQTFNEIISECIIPLEKDLLNHFQYFAHTKNDFASRESLKEHTDLVLEYSLKLIQANNLESIIDRLITQTINDSPLQDQNAAQNYIKELFIKSIYCHDFGKTNENFQRAKMINPLFQNVIANNIDSKHSILSAYLFTADSFKHIFNSTLNNQDKNYLYVYTLLFTHPILKHHGWIDDACEIPFEKDIIESLKVYLQIFENLRNLNDRFSNFLQSKDTVISWVGKLNLGFSFFALLKLNSSLLTASDYYATNEFMVNIRCDDFGIINESLREKIISGVSEIYYNKEMYYKFDYYNSLSFTELNEFSNTNLNLLRQKLSSEVVNGVRNTIEKRLFYIEAPTGSGKTNLSILVLAELLKNRKDTSKIFYVFPFTTLITQTFKFLKENLHLKSSEIAEIHSKAPFNKKEDDAIYGNERKNYIDNLFVNYPISLVSHIKFFDILTSNEKESNYLLHRIANSIVIIDEIQSYNPSEWDKVNYLIQKYSEMFNITFIIMSATLPKINKLLIDKSAPSNDDFVYLVSNKSKYFSNPNFKERVKFRFDYLDEEFSFEWLSDKILNHSKSYFDNNNNGVKAIVEFVKKISAHKFFKLVSEDERFCTYEIIIITGTILEPRRKEIINYLKSDGVNNKKIFVITTQVIEAGLDIDMDIGFKDKAILDSEEQFAGRINRNATKSDSELFLFNSHDSTNVYRTDLRYKQKIDIEFYKRVLQGKEFDNFYEKVFSQIDEMTRNIYLAKNLSDFQDQIRNLRFREVSDQFKLINNNSITVFVPLDIPKKYFTVDEINYIKTFNTSICKSNNINGEVIWNIYGNLITNKVKDFDKKIDLKIISSILSKYCFSMYNNPAQFNLLCHYGEIKYGYFYFGNYQKIYSYENGLTDDIETDCNFI